MKRMPTTLIVVFMAVLVSAPFVALAQLSGGLSTYGKFTPGDKILLKVDESTCPLGGTTQELSIVRGGYECIDYGGTRWIRPFDQGLRLYRELSVDGNFSLEFDFYTFREGCPYVRLTLLSGKSMGEAKKRNIYFENSVFISLQGSCDYFEAGISSLPVDNPSLFEYKRKIDSSTPHRVALSFRDGVASIFLDGKKIASEPFSPSEPIRGLGILFHRKFSTDKPYADYPALLGNLKLAMYTGSSPQGAKSTIKLPRQHPTTPKPVHKPTTVATSDLSQKTPARCIDSVGVGEASVIGGDRASARTEALARAKWDAIEKALGVTTSVKTILHNFSLLDEVIKNEVGGFIKNVKVLGEENFTDMVRVKIKGCVYPKEAEKALSLISRDTAFSVVIVTKRQGNVELDEMNPVTTELVNILNQQGFKVYDLAGNPNVNPYEIEDIIAQRRFISLRAYMSRVLSGAMVVGKVELVPSTRTGQDIGYGISAPFNVVTARLNYFLLGRDEQGLRIMASGSLSAMGRGPHIQDAEYKAMENLARTLGSDIMAKIERYMASKRKVVNVIVEKVRSTRQNFAIKEKLQRVPWVQSVEDVGLGRFRVNYLENTVYLANAIERIPELKLLKFSATEIVAELY